MNKLLFIGNTRLGDAVMSTGLLNELTNYYDAKVTIVCGKVAAPVFEAVSYTHLTLPTKA